MVRRIAIIAPHFAEYSERMAAGLAERLPIWLALNAVNRKEQVGRPIATKARIAVMPMNRRPHQAIALLRCVARVALFRADVVIVQEGVRQFLKPMVMLLRCFTRVALIVHDPSPHSGSDSALAMQHMPYRRWLRERADVLIVHGATCRRALAALGYDEARIVTIDHGVLMVPDRLDRIAPESRRVLMFGRMEAYKGLDVLLDAVAMLNDRGVPFRLVVAGAGDEQERLAARMAALGNVEAIARYLSPEEAEEQIARAAFVVAPYTDATQSGVLASTFANGRPVIVTDVGGLSDVVEHDRNGLLVPPRDPAALAAAMEALLVDEARTERLAAGARAFAADRLDWRRIADHLVDALDALPQKATIGRSAKVHALTAMGLLPLFFTPHPLLAERMSLVGTPRFEAPDCAAAGAVNRKDPPVADMYGTSELQPVGALRPDGQPMSWALHPRIARGNDPRPGWTSMVGWGQVFISAKGDESRNTRVEIRNMRLFVRPKTLGGWCLLRIAPAPKGAFYRADYAGDEHEKGDQRMEADGGRSFRPTPGRAIHFFTDRVPIPPGGLTGVYADFEARLIKGDPDAPDDRGRASLVASAGADYWLSDQAPAGHVLVFNEDAGIGRFRRVMPAWQTYSMNTAAPNAIRSIPMAPPPPSAPSGADR